MAIIETPHSNTPEPFANRPRFDPVLLQSFLAVVEMRSFTRAASLLGLRQSTVSQHVARLEILAGNPLIPRDTHKVIPTSHGNGLRDFARQVLEAEARIDAYFTAETPRGRIRIGMSENFAFPAFSGVIADFSARHPNIELELDVRSSFALYERFNSGGLDVVFVERRKGDERGQVVHTGELCWVGRPGLLPPLTRPVPLLIHPPPDQGGERAIAVLEEAGISWRIACASESLDGLYTAAFAGLGFAVQAARQIPAGLTALPPDAGLPPLGGTAFVVIGTDTCRLAGALAKELVLAAGGSGGETRPRRLSPA
jgi:DNA-binding transcriptional LysR family regulator